ncbi:cyclin-domain-containing protein [Chiua virens]|nr:cyclin-domain-containing protein [Chiua virens]
MPDPISLEIGAWDHRARLSSPHHQIYKGGEIMPVAHPPLCRSDCARMPLFTLSSLTCHRFIIASITVCSKGLCDTFCTNSLYARVGGIPVSELNVLEREFLRMIDWRLTCTHEVLQEYYVNLVRTDSSGRFVIPRSLSTAESSASSESDLESMASRSPSPTQGQLVRLTARSPSHHEPSTILLGTATLTPQAPQAPTLEQNMAFADLQNSLGGASGIPFGRPR